MPRDRLDLSSLEAHVRAMKLGQAVVVPKSGRRTLAVSLDNLVPVIQADVGGRVPIAVYRFRLLVPVMQVIRETTGSFRRLPIATTDEIEALQVARDMMPVPSGSAKRWRGTIAEAPSGIR